jgi:hypothetical protein
MADDPPCKDLAEETGAVALTKDGCVSVIGKVIPITSDGVDIQEAAEITNFNFHRNGTKPALPSPEFSPAPVQGLKSV